MKIVKSGPFRVRLSAEKENQDGNVPSRRHILGSKIFKEQLLEIFGKNLAKKVFGKKVAQCRKT